MNFSISVWARGGLRKRRLIFDSGGCAQEHLSLSSRATLMDGVAFCLDATAIPDDVLRASEDGTSVLPTGVVVRVSGNKWKLPKAGTFKGSFALYRKLSETKLKKVAVTVNGVVVNGVGYGTAVIKKTALMPVTVEWLPAK